MKKPTAAIRITSTIRILEGQIHRRDLKRTRALPTKHTREIPQTMRRPQTDHEDHRAGLLCRVSTGLAPAPRFQISTLMGALEFRLHHNHVNTTTAKRSTKSRATHAHPIPALAGPAAGALGRLSSVGCVTHHGRFHATRFEDVSRCPSRHSLGGTLVRISHAVRHLDRFGWQGGSRARSSRAPEWWPRLTCSGRAWCGSRCCCSICDWGRFRLPPKVTMLLPHDESLRT